MTARTKRKKLKIAAVLGVTVLLSAALCVWLALDKNYGLLAAVVAVLALVPFFVGFERGRSGARKLVLIAVFAALGVAGRFVFAFVPGFKPVTAITVIAGMTLGGKAGFMTGAISALVSNIFFGQGIWTPFQMIAWGMTGLFAGFFSRLLKNNRFLLALYGIVSAFLFTFIMDVYTTLTVDGAFNFVRYLGYLVSALPFTAVYALSNVIFLLLLAPPMTEKVDRALLKYGINAIQYATN